MSETVDGIQFYLARHGVTSRNLDRSLINGRNNSTPLTEQGIEQSIMLGNGLKHAGIYPEAVYVTSAVRSQQTAEHALRAMGCELESVIDDDLHEMSQGEWEGQPRTLYTPKVIATILADPRNFSAPGGESVSQVWNRMERKLGALAAEYYEPGRMRTIFGVGHGLSSRIAAGHLLGWTISRMRRDTTPNGSVSLLQYDGRAWNVPYIGRPANMLQSSLK